MDITVQGLTEVEVALDKATSRMLPEVAAVLGKAGLNIKQGVQRRWSGMPHLRKLPSLVGYDVWYTFGGIMVEVGPRHVGQGELANFAEFGSVNNAPVPALAPELDLETPKTLAALENLLPALLAGEPTGGTSTGGEGLSRDSAGRARDSRGRFVKS